MEVLYTSSDVHKAIKKLFGGSKSTSIRRVAIVAYLGVNAESFLPYPKGIEIVCNPEPGATDPASIRSLIAKGAKIQFSDKLHSKVYWSENGCIITSANISYRALGYGNQKETGILIDSTEFDIDRLIEYVEPYKITQRAMDKLEISDRAVKRATGVKSNFHSKKDYLSWYLSAYREPWKVGWWSESELTTSKAAIEKSSNEYSVTNPNNWLNVAKNQVRKNEWLLCFEITDNGLRKFEWMYVDFVVPVSSKDINSYENDYPFQAVQVHNLKSYPFPPFSITKEFRSGFKKAAKTYGVDNIESSSDLKPRKTLLKYLADYFSDQ